MKKYKHIYADLEKVNRHIIIDSKNNNNEHRSHTCNTNRVLRFIRSYSNGCISNSRVITLSSAQGVKMSNAIVWFRNILRIHDNPLLDWAESSTEVNSVIPVYILEENWHSDEKTELGVNRLTFLLDSLLDLDRRLNEKYGANLLVFSGDAGEIIKSLLDTSDEKISWLLSDYCSEPKNRKELNEIKEKLSGKGVEIKIFSAVNTILDIEKITQRDGFKAPKSTKDMKKIFEENNVVNPDGYLTEGNLPIPKQVSSDFLLIDSLVKHKQLSKHYITSNEMRERNYQLRLDAGFDKSYFLGGETEALKRLKLKISDCPDYVSNFRKPKTFSTNEIDNLMEPSTTGLSAYISNGCLSVKMVWNECTKVRNPLDHSKPPESLHGQLMFREMFYLLSRHVENWDEDHGNSNCIPIDWGDYDEEKINAWESGKTGFPYIDSMMRQLDSTGWMHHLGRHAVSCFFTRGQLWQNWKYGRDIFQKKLVDSDWAVNNGNWLWLAGVAPFSMPYYRVYNPCPDNKSSLNVETKNADFIRYWVPELALFPSKYIFEPHLAPLEVQRESNCIIGRDYPLPIVERNESRKENITKFKLSNMLLKEK